MLREWNDLPAEMQTEAVKKYYDILQRKRVQLWLKRIFDVVVSAIMLLILSPIFLILAAVIKLDSPGPIFYRQERVTRYGQPFRIFKFRSMVANADTIGSHVTVDNDPRVTKVGRLIRKCRLDEIPQLLNVLNGTMTFVGTRPEAVRYIDVYTDAMWATLLLPAGITSEASIFYKDEGALLDGLETPDDIYTNKVLPEKMFYNLKSLENFSFFCDIRVMFMTVMAVLGKEYTPKEKPPAVAEEETQLV